MSPSKVRVDEKAPNWPWDPCDPCHNWAETGTVLLCSAPCGSPTGVALFEPRNWSCLDLRIPGKWGRKSRSSLPATREIRAPGNGEGNVFRGGLDFSVKRTSTLLCFSPVSSVLFQLSGFPRLPLITACGLFLLHSREADAAHGAWRAALLQRGCCLLPRTLAYCQQLAP